MNAAASLFPFSVVLAMTLADVALAGEREPRSHSRVAGSSSVDLVGCGLNNNILFLRTSDADSGEWGAHPRIWLELANRADRSLWVVARLTAPFPDRACEHRFSLERKERGRTLCTQDSVVAGVDYTVDLTVFADRGFADTVETSSWSLQLEKSGVEEWESNRRFERGKEEAKKLPQSYEYIILKSGFVEGLTGDFPKAGGLGKLTVSSDSLEYVSAKHTFRL